MSELTCLELSVVLWVAHVLTQAVTARAEFGDRHICSRSRDKPAGGQGSRLRPSHARAGKLCRELTPFVAMALALIATQRTGGIRRARARRSGFSARIVYYPALSVGVVYVRTAVWAISIIGLLMMLSRLIGW